MADHPRIVALVLAAAPLVLAACPAAEGECARPADCGPTEDPPCELCPAIATALCSDGACVERAAADVDVTATFLVDRDLDGVNGLAWAIAVADRGCAAFDAFAEDLNVLAAGQKTLAGGDLHPDLQLAPVPAGPILVLGLATSEAAGDGAVLGSGCVAAEAAGDAVSAGQVDLQ